MVVELARSRTCGSDLGQLYEAASALRLRSQLAGDATWREALLTRTDATDDELAQLERTLPALGAAEWDGALRHVAQTRGNRGYSAGADGTPAEGGRLEALRTAAPAVPAAPAAPRTGRAPSAARAAPEEAPPLALALAGALAGALAESRPPPARSAGGAGGVGAVAAALGAHRPVVGVAGDLRGAPEAPELRGDTARPLGAPVRPAVGADRRRAPVARLPDA